LNFVWKSFWWLWIAWLSVVWVLELCNWVYDWIVLDFWTIACENRLGIWYFRLSEQLSLERKHHKLILCLCARSRLGDTVSLEWESLSSKRDSLAWARIRLEFGLFSVSSLARARMTRLSERALSPGRDLLA